MPIITSAEIATNLRAFYSGKNWTSVGLRDTVNDISWQQATTKLYGLNTIAALIFHISYYVRAISSVLEGKELTAKDKYSFDHPPISAAEDWNSLLEQCWSDAENLAVLIDAFPTNKLNEYFFDEKYGTYHQNFIGLLEHSHYHLGQIVLIKKMLAQISDVGVESQTV